MAAQRAELQALQQLLEEQRLQLVALQGAADEGMKVRAAREAQLEVQLEEARWGRLGMHYLNAICARAAGCRACYIV